MPLLLTSAVLQVIEINLHHLPAGLGREQTEAIKRGALALLTRLQGKCHGLRAKSDTHFSVSAVPGRIID